MALSRFWLVIILASITYILVLLFSGQYYSIEYAVNGKKDDPIVRNEFYLKDLPASIQDTLKKAKDNRYAVGKDSLYILDNQTVRF